MIIFRHAGRTKKGVKWPAVNQALHRKSYRSEALLLGSKELDGELGCYWVHLWPLKRPNSVKSADQGLDSLSRTQNLFLCVTLVTKHIVFLNSTTKLKMYHFSYSILHSHVAFDIPDPSGMQDIRQISN